MPKKKKQDKEEQEKEEESELEQEVEEQETPSRSKFNQFLQTKSSAPILERVTQGEPEEVISLEKGIETTPIEKKEEPETKYEEAAKYDVESEYQQSIKRQREITADMVSQVAPAPTIDLQRVGREPTMPGQEFQMRTPAEMPEAPTSSEEYDIIKKRKPRFTGEKTPFQEKLEKRYEFD